jgi:integrase/recombinase XerD
MKTETKLRKIINEFKIKVSDERLTPQQLRYVFKQVRNELGLVLPKIPKTLPRYLNPQEIYHFLECASKLSPRHRLFAEFLISTGLRVNEARNVMIEDFKENNQLFVRVTKFSKQRYVLFTNSLKNKIDLYMKGKKGYLWINSKNKLLSKRALQKWIEQIVKVSGLNDVHTHSLRHTFACMMLAKGMRLEELKTLMGHTSIKNTEIYGRLELGEIKQRYLQFMGDM